MILTSKSINCRCSTSVISSPLVYSSWASWATVSVWGSLSLLPYRISFMETKHLDTSSDAFAKRQKRGHVMRGQFQVLCKETLCSNNLWCYIIWMVNLTIKHDDAWSYFTECCEFTHLLCLLFLFDQGGQVFPQSLDNIYWTLVRFTEQWHDENLFFPGTWKSHRHIYIYICTPINNQQ